MLDPELEQIAPSKRNCDRLTNPTQPNIIHLVNAHELCGKFLLNVRAARLDS